MSNEPPVLEATFIPDRCTSCGWTFEPGQSICPNCTPTKESWRDSPPRSEPAGPKHIGDYRILKELGTGGMGTVYEAFEEKMQRRVALKVLARHLTSSEKVARRFEHEAWIAGKLDHPNLVTVYERGHWEDFLFYSMEIVDGGSLNDVITNMKLHGRDDGLGLVFGTREYTQWAILQIIAACRGADHAHQRGIVHRDIKPMNLLLSRELGTVKVADFGLAFEASSPRLTTVGTVMGTLMFMAPEQMLGKNDQVGPPTDVYAFGVTLFELLTLQFPFVGETQQLYMKAVLSSEARRAGKLNRQVGGDLEVVLHKAMEKNPRDRYQTAGALANDLENVLQFRPILARPPSRAARLVKWARRNPIHATLLATLVVGTPAVGVLGGRELQHRRAERLQAIDGYVQRARWLEERRRYDDVIALSSRILELEANNPSGLRYRALGRLALSLASKGPAAADLAAAAVKDADRVVALFPDQPWSHVLKAFVLRKLGRMDDAAREDALAGTRRPEEMSETELDVKAQLAMQEERYEDAVTLLTQLILREPENARAIASRGYAYDALGHDDTARFEYRLALGLNKDLDLTYIDLARLSKLRGRHDEAAAYLARSLKLAPESAHAHEAFAMNLVDRGKIALVGGDRAKARALLLQAQKEAHRAIELNPSRPWAFVNLGAALIELARLDGSDPAIIRRAIEANERARSMSDVPTRRGDLAAPLVALKNICDARIELRDLHGALDVCRQVVDAIPADPVGHYNLAGVYALLGRETEAWMEIEKDVALGDRDWEYLAHDPWFASMRSQPRFERLLRQMKQTQIATKAPESAAQSAVLDR